MIIGIGVDVVQITRIEKILTKYGNIFKNRILEGTELQKMETLPQNKQASFIAKRFAAKEAVTKALGCGISDKIGFKDIIIFNDQVGKPHVQINQAKINNLLPTKKIKIDLSITDDYPIAIAFTVISI